MNDKRIEMMRDGKISKVVMTMALPAIIGLLVQAIYNIVDTMFVSWLGPTATGATQVVFPLTMILSAIGLAFGMGAGSYLSRLLGENKKDEADKVASTSYFTSLAVGIVVTVLTVIFLEPLLRLLGATDTLMPMSMDYGLYIALGGFAQISNMCLNNLLRAEGSPKYSMIGMGAGALLNIVLDPIFIFTFGWGIKGAAIATSLSQIITTIILLSYYKRSKTVIDFKWKKFTPSSDIYGEIFKIGVPTFFRQLLMSVSIALLNLAAVQYGGDVAIAAIGIVTRTTMIVMYIIFGFCQGYQPVAGYNYGQKRNDRLYDSTMFSMKFSVIFSAIMYVIFIAFGRQIFSIYKPTAEVMEMAIYLLKYFMVSILLMSVSNLISVYYQALGEGMKAFVLSIARQGIFFIPLILILPKTMGIEGVALSQPGADVLTLIVSLIIFIPDFMRLKKASNMQKLEVQNQTA